MAKKIQTKIESTAQNWDNGTLGASEEHALPSSTGEHALDQAMAMQSISIRLEKTLIDELKMIADINGLGYQPLIRRVLHRFTNSEIKKLVRENAGLIKKQNKSKLFDDDDLECA